MHSLGVEDKKDFPRKTFLRLLFKTFLILVVGFAFWGLAVGIPILYDPLPLVLLASALKVLASSLTRKN